MAAVVVAREKPCSQALEQEELRTHRAHEARTEEEELALASYH